MSKNNYILVINAGSATLKFKVYDYNLKEARAGIIERVGLPGGVKNHSAAMRLVLAKLKKANYQISAVGHRVVHGGEEFVKPTLVTPAVLQKLAKYNQLAPLHNPLNLECLKICQKELKGVKNIAVFDTAFYQTVPDYIYLYALPLAYYQKYKIRRYGFHGLAHQYAAEEAAHKLNKKLSQLNLITCHLGSGSSVTAIKNGQALDTTMGFTPLEGLTMSTRAGDLDASVPLYLMKELKMSLAEVIDLLNKKSGLLGIAGVKDMREVLSAAGYKIAGFKSQKKINKKSAKLALQMFVYDVQRYVNAYAGLLGKVDAIVFSGGIGERSPIVRQLIMEGINWPNKIKTLVVSANEELLIAREVGRLVKC